MSLMTSQWRPRLRLSQDCNAGPLYPCPCFSSRCGWFQFQTLASRSGPTLGLRPHVVSRWCCVWINSRIHVSKHGTTNNPFPNSNGTVTFWECYLINFIPHLIHVSKMGPICLDLRQKKPWGLFNPWLFHVKTDNSSQKRRVSYLYVRQLYGIPPLVPPFDPTAGGNLSQVFKRPLATPWPSVMVGRHFCSVPVTLLSRECLFPQLLQRQCAAFVLIIFSCEPSLYVKYHIKPKWRSCQPVPSL